MTLSSFIWDGFLSWHFGWVFAFVLQKLLMLPACAMNGFMKRMPSSVQGLELQGESLLCVACTVLCSGCTVLQASCMGNVWSLARMCWVLSKSALICLLNETWMTATRSEALQNCLVKRAGVVRGFCCSSGGSGQLHWDWGKLDLEGQSHQTRGWGMAWCKCVRQPAWELPCFQQVALCLCRGSEEGNGATQLLCP